MKNNKDPKIAKFVTKLIKILENQSYMDIISFDDLGENIIIHQKELFENQILITHFKHNHLESFTRQMNNYGFQRIKNSFGKYEFKNPFFVRDERQMHHMVMKKKQQKLFLVKQFRSIKEELNQFSSQLDQFNFFASQYEKNSRMFEETQSKMMIEVLGIQSKRKETEQLITYFFQCS